MEVSPPWLCPLQSRRADHSVKRYRTLCRQIYRPPILPPELPLSTLVKRHGMDYRTTFLEERRVRYDGVYISVCHYMWVWSWNDTQLKRRQPSD